MLKNKFKMIVVLFTIISLISAFCIIVKATEDTPVVTSDENVDATNEEKTNDETSNTVDDTNNHEHDEENNEILKKDLYLFDTDVTMDKIVDGNAYIFGKNVKITGKINGNLFVFGNKISFEKPYAEDDTAHANENYCYVSGSIYAFGEEITFDGITQNIYTACNKFQMSYDSYIMRDLYIASNDATIKGYITRDVYLTAEKIDFGTHSENYDDNDSAEILGNLYYTSNSEIEIPEGTVAGEVTFKGIDKSSDDSSDSEKSVFTYLINLVNALIFTVVMYFILSWLSPKFFENTADILKNSSLVTLGIGTIALIVTPIIGITLLILTLFSLSLTLIAIYSLLIALSFTIVSGSLTYLLKDKFGFENKKVLLLIIITIILWALKQIPILGALVTIAITIFGLGIIIKNIFNKHKMLELKEQN